MDSLSLPDIAAQAADIARQAGQLLRSGFAGTMATATKSTETDVVTEYDTRAEALILDLLDRHFPGHAIVAEESGRSDRSASAFRWFVDPIDGTNNFAHGLGHFCTSLGLYENGRPKVGVIYDPLRDELFSATAGGGAFLTGPDRQPIALGVTDCDELIRAVIATGFAYDKHINPDNNLAEFAAMTPRVRGIRRFGSAALDAAYVAAGRFDGYWEKVLHPWDVAAGILIVCEAGGTVTTLDLASPDIDEHPMGLIFSNGGIHEVMHQVLADARPAT